MDYERKEIVPIMSGNVRYLGLSVPEWAIYGVVFSFCLITPYWLIGMISATVLSCDQVMMDKEKFYPLLAWRSTPYWSGMTKRFNSGNSKS